MKRITVSLPDELVARIKKSAGDGNVSAYVATALAEHEEQESLDELLAAWRAETPVSDEVHQKVLAELEAAGFDVEPRKRMAG